MRAVFLLCFFLMMACSQKPEPAPNAPQAPTVEVAKQLKTQVGTWQVTWVSDPTPIPLNQPFALQVAVASLQADGPAVDQISLQVDGRMPHHRHGMNREPVVTQTSPGSFRVENMMFHMPGRWELYFDISHDGMTERAQDVVILE